MPKKKETLLQPIDEKKPDFHEHISKQLVSNPHVMVTSLLAALHENTPLSDGVQIKNGLDDGAVRRELAGQIKEVESGDLSSIERILVGQIHLLNHWFMQYLQGGRASHKRGVMEMMLAQYQLALKMQEQTRKTAATLGALKQPKQTSFIKQQVNNADNQQIINGPQVNQRTENILQEQPNKLMEGERTIDAWVDTGAQTAPGRNDPKMEAVGTVNRTKNSRRQRAGGNE